MTDLTLPGYVASVSRSFRRTKPKLEMGIACCLSVRRKYLAAIRRKIKRNRCSGYEFPVTMSIGGQFAVTDTHHHQTTVPQQGRRYDRAEKSLTGGYTVRLARSNLEFTVPPGRSILQVLQDAGMDIPYSCEQGICGSCETKVLAGEPDHRDAILSDEERSANKTIMICCSGAKTDLLVLDI